MKLSYPQFFRAATGNDPYDWQIRLAEDPTCQSRLIDIPTGLGKTAGVILAWLWNRLNERDADIPVCNPWPRRLVYCLPMRTLVDQTEAEVNKWLQRLIVESRSGILPLSDQAKTDLQWLSTHSPIILMGGEDNTPEKRDWDLHPEKPAILIGTQDMLLSRALNRGYGMSRYRWPMHFALLNNDALWIMDEVQLMGVGIETSAQLEGLRLHLGTIRPAASWWMSATLTPERLETPNFTSKQISQQAIALSPTALDAPAVARRANAPKQVEPTGIRLTSGKTDEVTDYLRQLAAIVLETHKTDSLTLVILNRVARAQELFTLLQQSQPPVRLGLIHSRFRPEDRATHMRLLEDAKGGILVATQAIEAGLDISARQLFTEIAPWSSLVQRFGRCNRDGLQPDGGKIHWMDLHSDDAKQQEALALPYRPGELARARSALEKCTDASPARLQDFDLPEEPVIRPILRHKDLVDLFDTTADVAGHDLDISGYIRDGEDTDVEVFWRAISGEEAPSPNMSRPSREEICRVSVNAFRSFLKSAKSNRIWRWQSLTNEWEIARTAMPGMTFCLASDVGGYAPDLGWTGQRKIAVPVLEKRETGKYEADEDDSRSTNRSLESLSDHTTRVFTETQAVAETLVENNVWRECLEQAALWHDVGKAHYHFQKMLNPDGIPPKDSAHYLAKAPGNARCDRKHFRHELASALAWLAAPQSAESTERDLIAYLIAAHHGKVRLSIRAMPIEQGPKDNPGRSFARGVWDGETLPFRDWPPIRLGDQDLPPLTLDLSILALGRNEQGEESWLERTLRLRDRSDLGPLRLAFLETLLRSADGRASARHEA